MKPTPRPLPRVGMATARRTWEDLPAVWHCCPAGPDISTTVPGPAPTTACLYGPGAAGPTSQRDHGRRRENRQSDPTGVGPRESAEHSPGAHAPLIEKRSGVAKVIARQAAGLLPRPHNRACVIRSTATVISSRQDPPVADAAYQLRSRPVGGTHQSAGPSSWRRSRRLEALTAGPAPSQITIVPLGVGLYKPPRAPMQRVGSQ